MEIRRLNTLRGLAAVIVLVSHYGNAYGVVALSRSGQFGVMLFFMLSAFLMAHLYLNKKPTGQDLGRYAVARIARVVPLLVVITVASFLVYRYAPGYREFVYPITDTTWLSAQLMLLVGVSVFWTIPPEIQFYALFAVLWALRPVLGRWLDVLLALLAGSVVFVTNDDPAWYVYPGLPVSLAILTVIPYFAVGMIFGRMYNWNPPVSSKYFLLSLLAVPILYPGVSGEFGQWSDFRVLIVMSAVFFCVVFLVPHTRILENVLGDFIGKISYSLYLIHLPILTAVKALGLSAVPGLAVFISVTVALSWLSFVLIEKPSRDGINQWFRGSRAVPYRNQSYLPR